MGDRTKRPRVPRFAVVNIVLNENVDWCVKRDIAEDVAAELSKQSMQTHVVCESLVAYDPMSRSHSDRRVNLGGRNG